MAVTKIDGHRQILAGTITNAEQNFGTPSASTDVAIKSYVDAMVQGLDVKASVRVSTTGAGTLASSFANGQTIDGITLVTGDRILIKDQASGAENGIYTVNVSGAPTRATDADTSAKVTAGMYVFVEQGTSNADTGWVLTTDNPITLGSTALAFSQFSGIGALVAGAGLTKTGNTVDVVSGNTAIVVNANDITLTLADTSLSIASGLKVNGAVTHLIANTIIRETPTGLVNGANTTYTLANTPIAGTEQVYLNGIQQESGAGNDYTISGATITYLSAPLTGDKIRVSYFK